MATRQLVRAIAWIDDCGDRLDVVNSVMAEIPPRGPAVPPARAAWLS